MTWVGKMLADYFMAFGFLAFLGFVVVLVFFDGKLIDFSMGLIMLPSAIFAWLRGEFVHWPKEDTQ